MAKNQKIISDIFKVKSIPKLFWTSVKTYTLRPNPISFVMLVIGLAMFGLGEAFLIAAGVGVSPWTVLAQGVSILCWFDKTHFFYKFVRIVSLAPIEAKAWPGHNSQHYYCSFSVGF